MAPGLLRLQIDNSPEGFFPQDAAALEAFRRMERDFGRDRGVRVVIEGERLWTGEGLSWLAMLEGSLAPPEGELGGVYAAAGPWRHHRWHMSRWPPADPEAFRELMLSDPLDREVAWVGPDGEWVTVLVGLFRLLPERRRATLAALEARLDGEPEPGGARPAGVPPGISARLSGLPVVSGALDTAQVRITGRIFPLLALVAVGLLVFLFRGLRGAVLPLALVGVTQTVLFGLMGYAGQRIDIVTLLLLPLVFVIMLAAGVHVLAYHRRLLIAGEEPRRAVERTYSVKAWPVLWTGATTSVGFASLAVSPVPSVRALGLWTAFGIAFGTLAALSFYPALLAAVGGGVRGRERATAAESLIQRLCGVWIREAVRRPAATVGAFGLVAVVAALALPRLGVDTGTLNYFEPDHPLRRQIERLEDRGLPTASASLVLELPGGAAGFDRPEALHRLADLAEELRREPLVWGAVSAGDVVANAGRYLLGPAADADERHSPRRLAEARAAMGSVADLERLLASVLTSDGERTRVTLFTPMRSHAELEPAYRRVERAAERAFPDARPTVTGQYPLVLASQRSLLRTLVLSLCLTLAAIAVIFRLLVGSTGLALRALVPNLWPVLLILGTMAWFGLPLDSATVMVAAVVLGLAVDDTLHSLGHVRILASNEAAADRRRLVTDGMSEVAGGHVATSVILCLGFLVPAQSELLSVSRFGLLASLAVAGALATDLLLVPALVATAPRGSLRGLAQRGRDG